MGFLCARWTGGNPGVIALVGLAGSGKIAIAARFLEALEKERLRPPAQGLFVWSFYQEPGSFWQRCGKGVSPLGESWKSVTMW
jgi:hypothetical protein